MVALVGGAVGGVAAVVNYKGVKDVIVRIAVTGAKEVAEEGRTTFRSRTRLTISVLSTSTTLPFSST